MAWAAPQDSTGDQRSLTATSTETTCPAAAPRPASGMGWGSQVGVPAPACTGLHYSTPGTRMRSVLVTSVNTHREEQEGTEQVQ